jgi:hypothetical protein
MVARSPPSSRAAAAFAVTPPKGGLPKAPLTVGEYRLVKEPIVEFGYLTVTVDLSKKTGYLTINIHRPDEHEGSDFVLTQWNDPTCSTTVTERYLAFTTRRWRWLSVSPRARKGRLANCP